MKVSFTYGIFCALGILLLAPSLTDAQQSILQRTPRTERSITPVETRVIQAGGTDRTAESRARRLPAGTERIRKENGTASLGAPSSTSLKDTGLSTQESSEFMPGTVKVSTRPVKGEKPVRISNTPGNRRETFSARHRVRTVTPADGKHTEFKADKNGRVLARSPHIQRTYTGAPKSSKRTASELHADMLAGRWWSYMYDDFEGEFPGYWILEGAPTWGITGFRASTGSKSAWCAGSDRVPSQGYVNDMNAWMIDGPFDLRNVTNATLFFDYFVNTEEFQDDLFVGLSTDGSDFTGNSYSGLSGGWIQDEQIIFPDFAGETNVWIGVNFYSDSVNSAYEGAYIDNVELLAYIPSEADFDLAVRNVEITDHVDELFSFEIVNYGPAFADEDSYSIDVYVDDVFDSSVRNSYVLFPNDVVTWDWFLVYQYSPGPHQVRIEVIPDDGDINPANNVLTFTFNIAPARPVDLSPFNWLLVDANIGSFDFDVYNAGPGTARPDTYTISVYVDNELDSTELNYYELFPTETALWSWDLAYNYPSGEHTIKVDVTTTLDDTDPGNNSMQFSWYRPEVELITDLRVSRFRLIDPANDIFTFRVTNRGPGNLYAGEYYIRVLVDGLEDSVTDSTQNLFVGWKAEWNWQLAYIYPPGLHQVTVEVFPAGTELTPDDNVLDFNIVPKGVNLGIPATGVLTVLVDTVFSERLYAVNGTPSYAWRYENGAIPDGVAISGEGIVYGTPEESGSYTFTCTVTDRAGDTAFSDITLEVLGAPEYSAPIIYDTILPPAFVNSYYEVQLNAAGGSEPYSWMSFGGEPIGMDISSAGVFAGIPEVSGEYDIFTTVEGSDGFYSSAWLQLPVKPAVSLLAGGLTKVKLTIPWDCHTGADTHCDTLRVKGSFTVPKHFVLDEYASMVMYFGSYPINLELPANAKWAKKAVFRTPKQSLPKGKATVKWTSRGTLEVSVTVKKDDIAGMLAQDGLVETGPASLILPVRIILNDFDTGRKQYNFSYTLKNGKGQLSL